MSDPWTREIGRVEIPGIPDRVVAIDHGAVTIGERDEDRLTVMQADELAAPLITACWMTSAHPCPADCGEPVHESALAVPEMCLADCGEIVHDWACRPAGG